MIESWMIRFDRFQFNDPLSHSEPISFSLISAPLCLRENFFNQTQTVLLQPAAVSSPVIQIHGNRITSPAIVTRLAGYTHCLFVHHVARLFPDGLAMGVTSEPR